MMRETQPQTYEAVLQSATARVREGQFAQAQPMFERLKRMAPGRPEGSWGLAIVAGEQGEFGMAIQEMQRAIQLAPKAASLRADFGRLFVKAGHPSGAAVQFESSLRLDPSRAQVWRELGESLLALNEYPRAREALAQCVRLNSTDADAHLALGRVEFELGDLGRAAEAWRNAAAACDFMPPTVLKVAELMFYGRLLDDCAAVVERAVARSPESAELRVAQAQSFEDSGRRSEAIAAYRAALDKRPKWGMALGGLLSLLKADQLKEDVLSEAQGILAEPELPLKDKAALGYGLGKAFEASGRFDSAFECWTIANASRRQLYGPLDRNRLQGRVDTVIGLFSSSYLAERQNWGSPDDRPVFIVGMPRSGTTLLEQMLGAHPDAKGLGELPTIAVLAQKLGIRGDSGTAAAGAALTQAQVKEAAGAYLADALRGQTTEARRIIDKAPINFFHVGLIGLLFPKARIILCRRDAMDICLSIYSENFSVDQTFSTDQDDLGFYYSQFQRLVDHWKITFPDRIREVHYEQLVASPQPELTAVLGFLGLDWNDACLEFGARNAKVLTPSKWQVRESLYLTSVGRWKRYASQLGALETALNRYSESRSRPGVDA